MKRGLASAALMLAIGMVSLRLLFEIFPWGVATADNYYLPLREIPLGEYREAVEESIVQTSMRVDGRRQIISLVINSIELAALLTCRALLSKAGPASGSGSKSKNIAEDHRPVA